MKKFYKDKRIKIADIKFLQFLFENKTDKQTILKNTFWLTLAQGISGVVNFFLIIYIARTFGPTEYGKFAFAFAFVSIFSTLFDFGLSTTVMREFARDESKKSHLLDILVLKVLLGAGILAFIFMSTSFISKDKLVQQLILNFSFYIFTLEIINIFYAFLKSQQKMEIEAIFRIAQILILSLIVISLVYVSPSVLNLSYAYIGATLAALISIILFFASKNYISFAKLSFNKLVWKEFLAIGWYLALAKGVGDIVMYSDSVMLGYWVHVKETGLYNAAAKINGLVLFPLALVSTAIFPALITMLKESKERFNKYWEVWMKGTVFFSVLLCVVVLAKADQIIETAYSKDFLPAASALKILMFMVIAAYIHNILFQTLLIFNQQKKIFLAMFVSAIVNIVLNVILIPRFGYIGASITAVVTHFITLCQLLVLTSRYTIIKPFNKTFAFTLFIAVVSGFLMYLSVNLMDAVKLNSITAVFIGIMAYLFLIMFLNRMGRNFVYSKT